MKMNPVVKFSLPAVLLLAITLVTGCATTKPVDWNSRVGHYMYNQAISEFGLPNRQTKLSDGKVVSKWFVQPPVAPRFNSGMTYYGSNHGLGAGQAIGSDLNNQMLQLTFGTNGTLIDWSKNY
jgi:hypothetical protein